MNKIFKNSKKLEKIFLILLIIGILLILLYTILSYDSSNMFNGLTFAIPLLLIPTWTITILIIYYIVKGGIHFYKKKKQYLIYYILVFILLFGIILCSSIFYINKQLYDLEINHIMIGNVFDDKVYFFGTTSKKNTSLYTKDKDDNVEIICDKIANSVVKDPIFIDNNYLYYTDYHLKQNRINLNTCEIDHLIDDYEYLLNTKTDEYIYMLKIFDNGIESYSILIKYDYKNNKILNENKINTNLYGGSKSYDYFIDYNSDDIYYIKNDTDTYYLMKNNNVLFTKDEPISLVSMSDNYILFSDKYNIYKFSLTEEIIVKTIENPFDRVIIISSGTNDNYFIANGFVFKYDEDLDDFIELFKIDDTYFELEVYNLNDKLVFTNGSYRLFVYDITKDELEDYNDVRLISYNNNKFYFLTNSDNIDIKVIE